MHDLTVTMMKSHYNQKQYCHNIVIYEGDKRWCIYKEKYTNS